jgi:hypothetical protein
MTPVPFVQRAVLHQPGRVLALVAAAALVACGGGGGGAPAAPSGVTVSGVAATGLALANATVDLKCASGTGTATTREDGGYDVTVTDGALPCIVRVTGTADGAQVTLHSLASGSGSTATANVTPLTELLLARATGSVPSGLFESFSAGNAPTVEALATARTELLTQLSTVVGRDLTAIEDPFTTALVADVAGDTGRGNAYDDALEALKASVPVAALPALVGQVASTVGTGAPVTLAEVITNVSRGTLANCPAALSGKYRLVEYTGAIDEVEFRFGTTNTLGDGTPIVPSSTQPCEFTVDATTMVIGSAGAGVFRDPERVGYIFPVQSHRLADVVGDWDFLESGIEETNLGRHFVGRMNFSATGAATVCEFDVMGNSFASCMPDDETVTIAQGTDGGFVLSYGSDRSPVYGYRAPNGALTLFGSNNPNHVTEPGSFRTHFVLTRPQVARTQTVGSVVRYWEFQQLYVANADTALNGTLSTSGTADQLSVTAASETSVTRTRASDSRVDTLALNRPITGLRFRAPVPGLASVFVRQLPGLDIGVAIDNAPAHFYVITVQQRPAATVQP